MWSPVEKTALAEAEIEYEDIVSTQIDVAFEIVESPIPELVGGYAIVWTTTPWTIPVNRAIAYGTDIDYLVVECEVAGNPNVQEPGWYLIGKDLFEQVQKRLAAGEPYGAEFALRNARTIKGSDLAGTIARHPMHKLGGFFAEPRPLIPAPHVTTDQGTGLVHMAPDHGEEDFEACKAAGISPVFVVDAAGFYRADWAWLGGQGSVINAKFNAPDGPICSDLREAGALLAASADFLHSYPHSWRSKAKVIYRCTPQWFIAMDKPLSHLSAETRSEQRWDNEGGADPTGNGEPTLRKLAMNAIAATRFIPERAAIAWARWSPTARTG
jgi:isoleucyl-tRNA synthetase